MTYFFDEFYCFIGHRNPQWRNNSLVKALRLLTRIKANLLLPLWYHLTASCSSNRLAPNFDEKQGPRLIVSLTSFPARIPKLWLVIESLLRQSHQPDAIILWLSKDQFPGGLADLPHSLTRLQQRGLRIEFREGDIRSHKKYYYCQKEYPNDIMVTADDDIFYSPHILERLWKVHEQHPQAIATNHAHQMKFAIDGTLDSYNLWDFNSEAEQHLFFIGAGTNLFPPHALHTDVCNIDAARTTCPQGDDIWLNAMAHLAGTPIVHTTQRGFTGLPVLNRDNTTLWSGNIGPSNGNDQQIKALRSYFTEHYGHEPFLP